MEIYFYDENMRYIGHRILNNSEEIPFNATSEVANIGDKQESYWIDGKWVISTIVEQLLPAQE